MKPTVLKRLEALVVLLSSLAWGAGLAQFAAAGRFSRYWADDYCYSAWVKTYGLWGAIRDWYQTSGNRLSTLGMVALSEAFGPLAIRAMPLLLMVVWVAASWVCLWQMGRLLRLAVPPGWWLWLALVLVYFSVLLAPDRLQSVYWRMGALHYSWPLPLLLLNGAMLVWAANKPGWTAGLALTCAGLLAFFAAGLSETFAALQAGIFGIGLLAIIGRWLRDRAHSKPAPRGRWLNLPYGFYAASIPLAATLVMMAIMALAPANAWRQAALPPPDNPALVLPYALRYALDFIFFTLRGRLAAYGVYLLMTGAAALWVFRRVDLGGRSRSLAVGALLAMFTTYTLIACSFAPSAYGGLAYPAGRAQMPAAFVLLVGLGFAAGLAALALRARFLSDRFLSDRFLSDHFLSARILLELTPPPEAKPPIRLSHAVTLAALLLVALASLYPLRQASIARQDQLQLAARAQRWDARDAQIVADLSAGPAAVTVKQTDVVQSLEDIGPDPANWVNICAAMQYGASSITALP